MMIDGMHYSKDCGCKNCKMVTKNNIPSKIWESSKWNEIVEIAYETGLKQGIKEERKRYKKSEKMFLERIKLEFDTCVCECGQPWAGTDADIMVTERLENL